MYRVCAPQTVRAMLGQACLKARTPSTSLPWTSSPDTGSIMAGSMPKNGREAEPGFVGVTPASGVMTLDPVSVCQYVCSKAVKRLFQQVTLCRGDLHQRSVPPPCRRSRNTTSKLRLQ